MMSKSNRKNMFMEVFLTVSYGMMRQITDELEIECEENGMSQDNFFIRESMNEGVKEYIENWTKITKMKFETSKAIEFASKLFYTILDRSYLGDDILEGLYFDKLIIGSIVQKLENKLFLWS